MAISSENLPTWDEIERSESYLVCSMFGEASSSASSVLKRLLDVKYTEAILEDVELSDMLESAGMVLVQSLKELGRTKEIIMELKELFGSVSAIPVQVFVTGVCFQMQEDPKVAQKFLKEFLSKWRCVDEQYYVLASSEGNFVYKEGCNNRFVIGVDKYLEVVEVYLTLLATVLSNMDLALSWIENTQLPEEKRQELLRRLHSIYSSKLTSSSQPSISALLFDEGETHSTSFKELNVEEGISKSLEALNSSNGESGSKEAILKLYGRRRVPRFWWFRTSTLKIGSGRFVISNGNLLLGFLMFLTYYYLRRRKQVSITRILVISALYLKKGVVDLWQLAFSYQVNPLAAVQPIPSATPGGSRR